MPNTSYILLARKQSLHNSLSRLADNVANASTAGYKEERNVFKSLLLKPQAQPEAHGQDFPVITKVQRDFSQGVMKQTFRPFDFAIENDGFFTVNTPLGPRYSRAGNFTLNGEGVLVTKEGYPVAAAGGGEIAFAPEDSDITVRADGTIEAQGEQRGQLAIVSFENNDLLIRTGAGFYRTDLPVLARPPGTRVIQGYVEDSNVSAVSETVRLTDVSNAIERVKQAESSYHETIMGAIRKLGDTSR